MHPPRLTAAVTLALALAGCGGVRMHVKPAAQTEPGLQHVVLIELADPSQAAEMTRDMQEAFPQIPTLRHWEIGPHVDTGRAAVQQWYTVGVLAQFDGLDGYKAFVEHPRHKALAEKWKPRWKRFEVYDFGTLPADAPR